jgi:hypothetical protein
MPISEMPKDRMPALGMPPQAFQPHRLPTLGQGLLDLLQSRAPYLTGFLGALVEQVFVERCPSTASAGLPATSMADGCAPGSRPYAEIVIASP